MKIFDKNEIKILKLLVLYRLVDLVDENEDDVLNTQTLFSLYEKLNNYEGI